MFIKTPTHIVPIPSIITSEDATGGMILNNTNIKSQVTDRGANIPNIGNVNYNTGALIGLELSVYTGTINIDSLDEEKESVMLAIQNAYTGSELANGDIYAYILNITILEDLVTLADTIVLGDSTENSTVESALGTFGLSETSVSQGVTVTISNNCSVPPTSYVSSNTSIATVSGNTITTLTVGTTDISPVGGDCGDNALKTLTVTEPPISQWRDIPGTNCTNDDYVFTLDGITYRWAGCNSVLGITGITTNADVYNGTCYDYAGSTTTTNCSSTYLTNTAKENIFNADNGVDNIWGKAYLWADAVQENNACPIGWHLSSDSEWDKLETYLNGGVSCYSSNCDGLGWDGYKLKDTTNNIIQALKLPIAGRRYNGVFGSRAFYAYLWSSTLHSDPTYAYGRYLSTSNSSINRSSFNKAFGAFSVRCVKD
ncbi:MAG: FISUMP domain-containing protein [Candidatus Gracilibacteria bacterium]